MFGTGSSQTIYVLDTFEDYTSIGSRGSFVWKASDYNRRLTLQKGTNQIKASYFEEALGSQELSWINALAFPCQAEVT